MKTFVQVYFIMKVIALLYLIDEVFIIKVKFQLAFFIVNFTESFFPEFFFILIIILQNFFIHLFYLMAHLKALNE